jgi:bacterioferritin
MKPTVLKLVLKREPPPPDIQTMRKRARKYIEDGVVISGYAADRETVIKALYEALATEFACALRYKRHYFKAAAANAVPADAENREDANEAIVHTDHSAARIVQLHGKSEFPPAGLAALGHTDYVEVVTRRAMNKLREMIKEDLMAERITLERYSETISYRVEQDPTARSILADERSRPTTRRKPLRDLHAPVQDPPDIKSQ